MANSCNLLAENWIPCRIRNGRMRDLNLVDVLCEAHKIREILHPSPLVTLAFHRLLLAVLHRVFEPSDWRAWLALWKECRFDGARVKRYLEEWHTRFDLFDDDHPFYQTSSVPLDRAVSTAKLSHELASGNNKTLFDHTLTESPPVLAPAEAARIVVALQAYAIGGLVSTEKGRKKQDGSADNAFMVKGAALLATGRNLFETLMLNLVQYNAEDEEPFAFDSEKDKPAWERDEDVKAVDRLPDGYLDWLTWQSRRIRLKPETDDQGRLIVREAVIMKGYQLPDGQWRYGRETMIAFRRNAKASANQEPWPALSFTEDKALWRDTLSLLQSVDGERARPKTLDWLADIAANSGLISDRALPLSAYGLCSDRASIDFWRQEHLPVSVAYLTDQEMTAALARALHLAEESGKALHDATWILLRLALIPDESKEPGKEAKKKINRMCDELAPGRPYWSRLETPFKRLLEDLPEDISTDQHGSTVYGAQRLPKWAETIRRAGQEAFDSVSAAVGESARALKARAKAEGIFLRRLNSILKPCLTGEGGGGNA